MKGLTSEQTLRERPEWSYLIYLIKGVISRYRGKHPGIITEVIIDSITSHYDLSPHETAYEERRKNHPERIRRLTHNVFRALAEEDRENAIDKIAQLVLKNFRLSRRREGTASLEAGPG